MRNNTVYKSVDLNGKYRGVHSDPPAGLVTTGKWVIMITVPASCYATIIADFHFDSLPNFRGFSKMNSESTELIIPVK